MIQEERLTELLQSNLPRYVIAANLGVSLSTLKRWIFKHGIESPRKWVCACGETDVGKFSDGRYTECKKCRSKRQRELYFRYKKLAVHYKGGKCCKCGYARCLAALDFHHRDPLRKSPDWRKLRFRSFDKIKIELDECDLLCRNCHAETHYEDASRAYTPPMRSDDLTIERNSNRQKKNCERCNKEFAVAASKSHRRFCGDECARYESRRIKRPGREELVELIRELPMTKLAQKFGVSDNAIRKWCKNYNIAINTKWTKKRKHKVP